jgi:hypothetical protein
LKRSAPDEDSSNTENLDSKRKLKPRQASISSLGSSLQKKNLAQKSLLVSNMPPLEEGFFEEVDRDELDRTIQQIREDRFFQREFAKDLKKFQ